MSKPEVVARLLTWAGPRHEPVPWEGVCARTFTEFPLENPFHGCWKEGEALIRLTDYEVSSAADKARIAELEDKSDELDRLLKEALMAFDIICPECRKRWLHRHCGQLPVTGKDHRIAAQHWLLEQCQQSLRENSETYVELDAYLRGDIDHNEVLAIKAEHEAALPQQGKEGE